MHLSTLRIRGFKSFSEPVELRFFPGVAVIVGPNGSGKSNIADAVQWAMASQAPSALRVTSSQDVLFAGSQRLSASGLAEVELVLDNGEGRLSVPHAEVSVMRRLTRSGDGEYLLNRVGVRRLDVQEMLADAGLGRELHCVISQGSVDAVLLSRPDERRGLVEEAAGLGKYKRRRLRARQKLARVQLDLERAADLEREIRARLRPLQLQATAADRAARLTRELVENQLRLLGSEGASARRQRATIQQQIQEVTAQRTELERRLTGSHERRSQGEAELGALASAQEKATARSWALAAAVDRLEGRRDAVVERLRTVESQTEREHERARRLRAASEQALAQATEAAAEVERLAAELARAESDDDGSLDRERAETEAALETTMAARRTAAEAGGRRDNALVERDRIGRRQEALAAERDAATAAVARASRQLDDAARAAAAAGLAAATAGERRRQAEVDAATTRDVAERARADERERRGEIAVLGERTAGLRARVEALSGAVARADGVAPAIRRLVERGATLALAMVQPDDGYAAAVAAALQRRTAAAIASDLPAALALLDGDGLDGATVLVPRGSKATAAPGGARPLTDVARLRPGAPDGLLDGLWLVDGPARFEEVDHGVAVTRDGLGWDADRRVAFRSGAAGEAALIAARAELDETRRQLAAAEQGEAQAAEALAGAVARRDESEAAERRATAATAEATRAAIAAERVERETTAAQERLARGRERAEHDLARRLDELAEADRAAIEASATQVELEDAAGRAMVAAEAAEVERRALESRLQELVQATAARRATAAALAERMVRARRDADLADLERRRDETGASAAVDRAQALTRLAQAALAAAGALERAGVVGARARRPAKEAAERFERRAEELSALLRACGQEEAECAAGLRDVAAVATTREIASAQLEERLAETRRRARELSERHGLAIVEAVEPLAPDEAAGLAARIERLDRRCQSIGAVNPLARAEYEEQAERAEDVAEQRVDLETTIRELDAVIRELSATIADRFTETFEAVQRGFGEVVETLFPGGRGRLVLAQAAAPAEGDDDTEASTSEHEQGVELELQPAGKKLSSMALLSGGERALAALAFLFALLLARPSPFYVLDEVDAALDDANIARFLELVERYRDRAQFIVITHQKLTMDVADVLYGVTMASDGVSRVLSRRVRGREPVH